MEKVAWESGTSRMVQGEVVLKNCLARPCQKGTRPCALRRQFSRASGRMAVPKRHTAVRLADGGIRILISSLTSQGQAGDFTSINPRAGD